MPYILKPDNIQGMVQEITQGEIRAPREIDSKFDSKLEAIILKLLKKNPSNRYQQMNEVEDDLIAYLDDQPISIPYKLTFMEKISSLFGLKK